MKSKVISAGEAKPRQQTRTKSVEQFYAKLSRAFLLGNRKELEKLLLPEFCVILPNGNVHGKADWLVAVAREMNRVTYLDVACFVKKVLMTDHEVIAYVSKRFAAKDQNGRRVDTVTTTRDTLVRHGGDLALKSVDVIERSIQVEGGPASVEEIAVAAALIQGCGDT